MNIEQIVREETRAWLAHYFQAAPVNIAPALMPAPKQKPLVKRKVAKVKRSMKEPTIAEQNVLAALANDCHTAGAVAKYSEGALDSRKAGLVLGRLVKQGLVAKHGKRRFTTYEAVPQNGATA